MKIKDIYNIVAASVMTCLVIMRCRLFQHSEIYQEGIMFYKISQRRCRDNSALRQGGDIKAFNIRIIYLISAINGT
jgi:hypothetical protein